MTSLCLSRREPMPYEMRELELLDRMLLLPAFRDLDSLPHYDYELGNSYILDRELVPMTRELLKARLASYPYRIPILCFMTSRGCPHNCSYCNNCRYLAPWGKVPIRLHSAGRVIEELEQQLRHLGFKTR